MESFKGVLHRQRFTLGAVALGTAAILFWQAFGAITGLNADRLLMGSITYMAAYAYLRVQP